MKLAIVALTVRATYLAIDIANKLDCDVYTKKLCLKYKELEKNTISFFDEPLKVLIENIFTKYQGIIFIMATGIVVRTIAPFIKDKTKDPAVLVIDEAGKNVISLLSGHLGGANELTLKVSDIVGANPVITTATDVNNVIAFDNVAKKNNLSIENIENLKYISGELINGGKVKIYSDIEIHGDVPENIEIVNLNEIFNSKRFEDGRMEVERKTVIISNKTDIKIQNSKSLLLRPKNLILGIGCRRGTDMESIENAILDFIEKNNKSILSLKCVATIDIKKNEKGILDFCNKYNLELKIIEKTMIENIESNFKSSEFVKKNVGVGSVAEPCSILGGKNTKLLCEKTVYTGITLALSKEEHRVYL